jgi:hypothetical protein
MAACQQGESRGEFQKKRRDWIVRPTIGTVADCCCEAIAQFAANSRLCATYPCFARFCGSRYFLMRRGPLAVAGHSRSPCGASLPRKRTCASATSGLVLSPPFSCYNLPRRFDAVRDALHRFPEIVRPNSRPARHAVAMVAVGIDPCGELRRNAQLLELLRAGVQTLKKGWSMARDIDYAATAVNRAIVERFGRANDLQHLTVTAKENTIEVRDGERVAEGTRHELLDALRKSGSYADLWQLLAPAA